MTHPARAQREGLLLAAMLMAAFSLPLHAFDLESDKPIEVESDSARLDDQDDTATYTGNVRVTQGEARLTADRVVLHRGSSQSVDRMEATGKPATYEQPETREGPAVYAEGETIIYAADEDRITFERKAFIRQDGDTFRGNRIVYDLTDRVVTASSSEDDDSDRVEMTIQPRREDGNGNND